MWPVGACWCMRCKHSANMLLPMQWATCFMLLQLPYANCSMQQKMVTGIAGTHHWGSLHAYMPGDQGWQLTRTSYTRTPVRSVLCYHVDALNACRSLCEDMQHELHFGLHVMGWGEECCMKVMCIFSPLFTGHALACMSYTAKTLGLLPPHF